VSVGETLATAREQAGLSVEDVSTATRIRAGLIRSIEADDFGPCGGAVYARGHIRNIARVVDLDPEAAVAEFDRSHADEAPPPLVPTPAVDRDAAARADRKQPNWTAAMVVALVVICAVAGISLLSNRHGSRNPGTSAGRTPHGVHTPGPSPSQQPPVTPPPSALAQVPTNQAIALVRVTSDRTWMSVTTFSGQVLFQGLISAGQHKIFRDAHGLRLTIGNAPAVDLVANGRDIGEPRSQGNVAHVTIARGGAVQYA